MGIGGKFFKCETIFLIFMVSYGNLLKMIEIGYYARRETGG